MAFGKLEDLHCHTHLSACCEDGKMTVQALLAHADQNGYAALCITDHLWDAKIPGASHWYMPQDIEHISRSRPLPEGRTPFYFGCETELPANGVPALARESYDLFDFVVIPPNHMHMEGLVRPAGIDTPKKMAVLIEDRLENLISQDLPFDKIGIAHLTDSLMFPEGTVAEVTGEMDYARLVRIFKGYAMAGAGIELNAWGFSEVGDNKEEIMKIYYAAKEAGCRFYLCSDAHKIEELDMVKRVLPPVIQMLRLEERDRYSIVADKLK